MPSRSKPFTIAPVRNPSGSFSHRVLGTIRGKQKKRIFLDYEDAKACQEQLELERIHGAAAARPKITSLTLQQLRESEAAFEFLKGTGMGLLDAVRYIIKTPPFKAPEVTWEDGLNAYLKERDKHLSKAHLATCEQRARSFGKFIGKETLVTKITSANITDWLESKKQNHKSFSLKSWNNYRADLSGIFEWFAEEKRGWIAKNPTGHVEFFESRLLPTPARERLEVQQCHDLMAYLEANMPHWCTFFALTLFAGIRPDMTNGEMHELSKCVGRDGADRYFHHGMIDLTKEITKTNRARYTTIHPNLAAWLKRYPPNPTSLCPGDPDEYMEIRAKFKIPHDGLRHTCISAHLARYQSFAIAAQEFGNSERIILDYYNRRMSASDADAFYGIYPTAALPQPTESPALTVCGE